MIFWGFIVLTIATTVVMLDYDFGLPIMHGYFYLYFQSFTVDVFGGLAIVGIGMAAVRRWIARPQAAGLHARGLADPGRDLRDPGERLSGRRLADRGDRRSLGRLVAVRQSGRPRRRERLMSVETMKTAHAATWWTHLLLVFGFIAWAPYTKMAHVVTSTLNIYTARLAPIGASLRKIDFENSEKSWASTRWPASPGRTCSISTPAPSAAAARPPARPIAWAKCFRRATSFSICSACARRSASATWRQSYIGATPALSVEAMWECTTCGACVEACPVLDRADAQDRRYATLPGDGRRRVSRHDAASAHVARDARPSVSRHGLLARRLGAGPADRHHGRRPRRRRAVVGRLRRGAGRAQSEDRALAGATADQGRRQVRHPGREEKCTGDPARRIGNEFLFETTGPREHRHARSLPGEDDRHLLPALLQHVSQRVSAVRRPLRGVSSQRVPGPAGRRRQAVGRRCRPTRRSPFTTRATWAGTTASTTRRASWCRSRLGSCADRDGPRAAATASVAAAAAA